MKVPHTLAVRYPRGDALCRRSVSDVVLSGTLDLPALPPRLLADWEREVALHLQLSPGDVEPLPLARARMRWPDYRGSVDRMEDWMRAIGLRDLLARSDVALMACRGARYHHDGAQYGGSAFCNLFVSDDKGLDLHFPVTGHRMPLARGTAVVFDTGQPHAVVPRGATAFDAADFEPGRDCTQVFLTWELPIDDSPLSQALGIVFEAEPTPTLNVDAGSVTVDGHAGSLCPNSGRWLTALPGR